MPIVKHGLHLWTYLSEGVGLPVFFVPGKGDHGMAVTQEPLTGIQRPEGNSEIVPEDTDWIGLGTVFDALADRIIEERNIMRRRVCGKDSDLPSLMI